MDFYTANAQVTIKSHDKPSAEWLSIINFEINDLFCKYEFKFVGPSVLFECIKTLVTKVKCVRQLCKATFLP